MREPLKFDEVLADAVRDCREVITAAKDSVGIVETPAVRMRLTIDAAATIHKLLQLQMDYGIHYPRAQVKEKE